MNQTSFKRSFQGLKSTSNQEDAQATYYDWEGYHIEFFAWVIFQGLLQMHECNLYASRLNPKDANNATKYFSFVIFEILNFFAIY